MKKEQEQSPASGDSIRTKDGQVYDVPPEGSLSLLALGYRGVMAWRAKRAAVRAAKNKAK